jgi:hypothetical protein
MRTLEIDPQIVSCGAQSHGLNNAKSAVRIQRLSPPPLLSYTPSHTKALRTSRNSVCIVINVRTETLYFIAGK